MANFETNTPLRSGNSLADRLAQGARAVAEIPRLCREGQISAIRGGTFEAAGFVPPLAMGDRAILGQGQSVAEVVATNPASAVLLSFGPLDQIAPGNRLRAVPSHRLLVCDEWLGRVIDPLAQPLDGRGALPAGTFACRKRGPAPPAGLRARLGPVIDLGVRALDAFCTMRRGQRMGLFAASGVGKSTLLSMLARGSEADVVVIALVGERGRELREFLEDDLGEEGVRRSVVVCATSDSSALMRREAAYTAMAVAEAFRDSGRNVMLLMDSVTRFALACREIGLAAGEPPATRGYPPSVFAELPRLLERAGPGVEGCGGTITGLFTVLVEGDDHDEPVADAVRGILDGHIVLDRRIGEAGRYPAIDVLRSLSRTVPGCQSPEQAALARRARRLLSLHAEVADLVRLGAYRPGADPQVDEAIRLAPRIEAMLAQGKEEQTTIKQAFQVLAEAVSDVAP